MSSTDKAVTAHVAGQAVSHVVAHKLSRASTPFGGPLASLRLRRGPTGLELRSPAAVGRAGLPRAARSQISDRRRD